MNVGVYLGNFTPDLGGSFTFQDNILRSLEAMESPHRFFVFVYGDQNWVKPVSGRITYVALSEEQSLRKRIRRRLRLAEEQAPTERPLQKEVERYQIDLMWFVSQRFEMVDIPYICTVLDLEHRVHPFFPEVSVTGNPWEDREKSFGSMIPRAAYIISGTEAGKQQIIDFYHPEPERVRVIPFPVSSFAREDRASANDRADADAAPRPYLFYPAQFWPHKNHVVLLHALKLLREEYHLDLGLVFCGSDKGNLGYVEETARELGVAPYLQVLGFVTTEKLYALYQHAFALVYPSIFGPDNLPPLEAFAIGCPVIAAKVAGAAEQLGDAALLVDPLSEQEIASTVRRLGSEEGLRQSLVLKGRERVQRLSSQDYAGEVLKLCDEFTRYRRCWSRKEKYIHL
jgi:glycosyltransferase involved in cell wall biosynthesis